MGGTPSRKSRSPATRDVSRHAGRARDVVTGRRHGLADLVLGGEPDLRGHVASPLIEIIRPVVRERGLAERPQPIQMYSGVSGSCTVGSLRRRGVSRRSSRRSGLCRHVAPDIAYTSPATYSCLIGERSSKRKYSSTVIVGSADASGMRSRYPRRRAMRKRTIAEGFVPMRRAGRVEAVSVRRRVRDRRTARRR